MKRKAILFATAFAFAIIAGHLFANRYSPAPATHSRVMINYIWYIDPDMTQPNGAYSDVTTELNRLRSLHPSNIFSTNSSGGLHGYEWGYYPSAPTAIIYSDL
jgi:hypothetical protein